MKKLFVFLNLKSLTILGFFLFNVLQGAKGQSSLNFNNFSLEDGLSNNYVHSIHMDHEGWMWFGTFDGLNRFDGYNFKQYRSYKSDSTYLNGRMVKSIFEDSENVLWFGTEKGLNKYNRSLDQFKCYSIIDGDSSQNITIIHDIIEDTAKNLWLGTEDGLLYFDRSSNEIKRFKHDKNGCLTGLPINALYIDQNNYLWAGANNGIVLLDLATNEIKKKFTINIHGDSDPRINQVECIFKDSEGTIWVGTYLGGLNRFDSRQNAFKPIHFPYNDFRMNTVRDIIEMTNNILLVATRNGLIHYNRTTGESRLVQNNRFDQNSLIHNSVLSFYKDDNNDIWIGTRGGISYLHKNIQAFQNIKSVPNNSRFLNSAEIWTILETADGKLWIGTEDGGVNILNRQKNTFSYITSKNSVLKSNNIKALYQDNHKNIWIGTYMGGLYKINSSTGHIKSFQQRADDSSSIGDDRIWVIFEDSEGEFWFGTSNGLDHFDKSTGTFTHYLDSLNLNDIQYITEDDNGNLLLTSDEQRVYIFNKETNKIKEFNYPARYIFKARDGNIWIGTIREGLLKLSADFELEKTYTIADGLCDNTVYGILEDNAGFMWLSTLNGISRFDPQEETFKNYFEYSGLPGNKFNYGAFCKTREDELVFGGNNGLTIFKPSEVKNNTYTPPIVFTELRINNKPVEIDKPVFKRVVLTSAINQSKKIIVNHHHSVLSFEFAALNYAASMNNMYSFKLEGFDESFSPAGNQRIATYTNLNPGEYTLLVKGSNNDLHWNPIPKAVNIEVLPPYWKTWWFKTLLFLLLGLLISFVFYIVMRQERLKHQIAYERLQAKRIHEMDTLKFKLFTDISHEIRTPLTLIMSPLEKILSNKYPKEEIASHLKLMHRNSKRLLSLVNQLLDYRKLEAGKLKLKTSKNNLVPFAKSIVESFKDLSEERNIKLTFNTVSDQINVWFDPDKLEIVIYNLLTNAFKFTNNGGSIQLNLSMVFHQLKGESNNLPVNGENKCALISVQDSGSGIHEKQLDKIFDRFYQSKHNGKNTAGGTGIGLALSKEIIELHHGEIGVESKPGVGTKFYIYIPTIPVKEIEEVDTQITESVRIDDPTDTTVLEKAPVFSGKKIVLIVEDNEELLNFIASYFDDNYAVLTALTGEDGLDKAIKYIPDVIISDVLMPGMDGKELCQTLKTDDKTSHIPIILLTALASKEHEKDGFIAGADAYITKPFDPEILKVRVDSMLSQRQKLQEKYKKNFNLASPSVEAASPDDMFIQKAINIVNSNIEDVEFDITKFSKEIGVSRTQLYRKFDALMNITVNDFIKRVRLEKAIVYLKDNKYNVNEIAYKVGFKDASYFRKCFKSHYGSSPSEYQKQLKT